ncbi:KH homology domain-containing protein 4-like [Uloborus diversus]|uniref:KH homology domain-containing protein 4-like n=1 Tax=Uloborus diversus TaxID=327109 RepID=UPI0024097E49|nr:KH homology domain-containing protein 4-like [Uloborus diversus]XP_054712044.1 KH homology domain-containing protein 4-like [Uloborus diversus]
MSKSSLEAAAEAAARVNAMLIAKGKLKISPSQIKPKTGNNLLSRAKISDLITAEVDINDAPISARNLLTRGHKQEEICKLSGAAISTRGRYMTPEERQSIATPECRPLYLNVQATTHVAVKDAINQIQEILNQHILASGVPKSPTVGVVTYPNSSLNCSSGAHLPVQPNHIPSGSHFVQDKVFIGLEQAPSDYPVREKIFGPNGSFLQHIRTETGATVTLRGKGSGFIEPTSGREAFEPLYIHITHPKPEGLQAAKALAINLVETAHVEFAQWQQTQQQSILQPLASVVLPQTAPVAYQNQVMVTPTVLPVNTALPAGSNVVATGIQIPSSVAAAGIQLSTPVAAGIQLPVSVAAAGVQIPTSVAAGIQLPTSATRNAIPSGIPSYVHTSVPALVTPMPVVSSVPVSVQAIPSQTVITYPTYVANANSIIARPAASVVARPVAPAVSILSVVPTLPAASAYTLARQRPHFQASQLAFTQPVVYASVPTPQQAGLTQAPIPPASMVMNVQESSSYNMAARFSQPPPTHQHNAADISKHGYYNGLGLSIPSYAATKSCLQESNVNHPTELQQRRGGDRSPAEDRMLMPPPVMPNASLRTEERAVAADVNTNIQIFTDTQKISENTEEPERKKLKGALGGLASIYGSDDSDEEESPVSSATWTTTNANTSKHAWKSYS